MHQQLQISYGELIQATLYISNPKLDDVVIRFPRLLGCLFIVTFQADSDELLFISIEWTLTDIFMDFDHS